MQIDNAALTNFLILFSRQICLYIVRAPYLLVHLRENNNLLVIVLHYKINTGFKQDHHPLTPDLNLKPNMPGLLVLTWTGSISISYRFW